ncbi:M48 family metallopeptidase [Streptomyces rishiriensis]|uniref:Zn-dependent protease with chaperone function n=1 Tax=Streptomyces rishiriensis TaxID=68264 RepID=A0ABU0NQQ1_STRRH|nr:M48 family metallopeptidase [Streptomyces rishiriensis]MDQ0581439.1 Zn-dependent protease with chaperone function [Streptomyces rishiriensis]
MTSVGTQEKTRPCPRCGAGIGGDERFTVWCAACDWNVDPEGPRKEPRRLDRTRRALARRHGEKLHAGIVSGEDLRARRDASALLALVIALAVHGVTAAVAALGIWCLVHGWGGWPMLPGLFLLLLAWVLRPRPASLPDHVPVLHRAAAPTLFALVDEVAEVAGTRGVDAIVIDGAVNASVQAYGMRGRRMLVLGMPYWEILTPQQRVALLGHELGHYGNGDVRHHTVLGSAYASLITWWYCFAPEDDPAATALELISNLLLLVPYWLVTGVLLLLDRLTLRASQRAEYLADRTSAHVGSTEAAVGLTDRMLVTDSVEAVLAREANRAALAGPSGYRAAGDRADELWERLTSHMASIPEAEYERQRRVGALRGHSVDATHPPTHLRRAGLIAGERMPAAVVVEGDRADRIAAELAGARRLVGRRIILDGPSFGG